MCSGMSVFPSSDTVELWRSLGQITCGIQVLGYLVEKVKKAGNDHLGPDSFSRDCSGGSDGVFNGRYISAALHLLWNSYFGMMESGALGGCLWRCPGHCAGPASRSMGHCHRSGYCGL